MPPLFIELPLALLAAALGQWLACWIAMLPARGLPADAHWTERARLLWSARLLLGAGPGGLLGVALVRSMSEGEIVRGLLLSAAFFFGATLGALPFYRRILQRRTTFRDVWAGYAVSFFVRTPAVLIYMAMLLLLVGRPLDEGSIVIMAVSFVIALALTLGAALPMVRVLGLLRPPDARAVELTAQAAARAGVPPPVVYLLRWDCGNALAFPFRRIIAVTQSLMDALNDSEVIAVCGHEIAHLRETAAQKLVRLSGLVISFPLFTIPVLANRFGLLGVVVPLVIAFVGGRLIRRFSQRMETRADAAAVEVSGDDKAHASALEKLYRINAVPAVMRSKRQTHPHLYDRLVVAGMSPDFPRPRPPSIWLAILGIILIFALCQGTVQFLVPTIADALKVETAEQRDATTSGGKK